MLFFRHAVLFYCVATFSFIRGTANVNDENKSKNESTVSHTSNRPFAARQEEAAEASKSYNETSSSALELEGFADSHETMNNPEINFDAATDVGEVENEEVDGGGDDPNKRREKRSYEFLMGLINNNSKYQVTKVESANDNDKGDLSSTKKSEEVLRKGPHRQQEEQQEIHTSGTEMLLELMIKIAADPKQWNKVHQLLGQINADLVNSKKIVTTLEETEKHLSIKPENNISHFQETKKTNKELKKSSNQADLNKEVAIASDNDAKQDSNGFFTNEDNSKEATGKVWPTFLENDQPKNDNVIFVNVSPINNLDENFNHLSEKEEQHKKFRFHRVTSNPNLVKKNGKAYIAVSSVGGPTNRQDQDSGENLVLEDQLKRLRPWLTSNIKYKSWNTQTNFDENYIK